MVAGWRSRHHVLGTDWRYVFLCLLMSFILCGVDECGECYRIRVTEQLNFAIRDSLDESPASTCERWNLQNARVNQNVT